MLQKINSWPSYWSMSTTRSDTSFNCWSACWSLFVDWSMLWSMSKTKSMWVNQGSWVGSLARSWSNKIS